MASRTAPRALIFASLLAAALGVSSPAGAAAPTITTAENEYGKASVAWTLPAGHQSATLELSKTGVTTANGAFKNPYLSRTLRVNQTSWTSDRQLPPARYFVHVSAVEGPELCPLDVCPEEWSETVELVIPPPVLVLGKSIAYVAMGMTKPEVYGILGTDWDSGGSSGGKEGYTWNREKMTVGFAGRPREVEYVSTWNKTVKVRGTNVGLGTREGALKNTIDGIKCRSYSPDYGGSFRYCFKGRLARGKVITLFWMLDGGRVSSMAVGKVLDRKGNPLATTA